MARAVVKFICAYRRASLGIALEPNDARCLLIRACTVIECYRPDMDCGAPRSRILEGEERAQDAARPKARIIGGIQIVYTQ